MTRFRTGVLAVLIAIPLLALFAAQESRPTADEQAIEEVIMRSYVDGLWRQDDADLLREGFASIFVFQRYWESKLSSSTLDEWIEKMQPDKVPDHDNVRGKVTVLDVTGVAAVARLDFWQNDRHTFTDYFCLYKTDEGWKVVTKTFHAHR